MDAKIVNLQEWESFGGGGYGESFYNKKDDSVMLKLNKASYPAEKSWKEYLRTKAVYEMGIPSARPYEFVTDGERYGMIVERIVGKESFGRIIADHPERLDELAGITAEYTKALHAIPCDTEVFDNLPKEAREMISASPIIPDEAKTRLCGYIDELAPVTTCLHGDLNPCNIITTNGKVYWIDLGDFGYGDPLMDFNILAYLSSCGPNPLLQMLFHLDRKMLNRFYQSLGRQYFGPVWDTPEHQEKMGRIAQIMAGQSLCFWPEDYHVALPLLRGKKLLAAINLFIRDRVKLKE